MKVLDFLHICFFYIFYSFFYAVWIFNKYWIIDCSSTANTKVLDAFLTFIFSFFHIIIFFLIFAVHILVKIGL